MIKLVCAICFVTISISLLVNFLFLKYTGNKFAKNLPQNIVRWEVLHKPAIGGISFLCGPMISLLAISLFIPHYYIDTKQITSIILCLLICFSLGIYDDRHNASVAIKFTLQILIAIILISADIYIKITHNFWINSALTIIWVSGLINSINMLDNMDGVTAIVSLFILIGILTLGLLTQKISIVNQMILLGVICSIIGFLPYNIYPSKMYMGDTGSLQLGCLLAIFSMIYIWNPILYNTDINLTISVRHILCTILIFIIPLCDTLTVFTKRISKGKSPFIGDKGHTTHHLVYAGVPQFWVPIIYAIITIVGICLALALIYWHPFNNIILMIISALYCIIVFSVLFYISLQNTDKE